MMRTDHGPVRALWGLAYSAAARSYAAVVLRGEMGTAYVRGTLASGEALHGIADVDVVIVVAPDPAGPGVARERVRRRCERVERALPVLGELVFDWPMVYEPGDLAAVAPHTTFTYGLGAAPAQASYFGPARDVDRIRLLERPELYGLERGWQLMTGPDRRPPEPAPDPAQRRIRAWLELQNWWRWAFVASIDPARPRTAYTCVKLIADPIRALLWLTRGEYVPGRREALMRGLDEVPEESEALRRALELHDALRRMPAAPVRELLPALVRLSSRIAREVVAQVDPAGWTEVALDAGDELALPHGGCEQVTLHPLVDWLALVHPREPDETFALVPGYPGDPGDLTAAAAGLKTGPYPTLSAEGIQIRPTAMGGRGRLRSVQCRATDPVSFAVSAGSRTARFPDVPGWSIGDYARRAVAEHAAWLNAPDGDADLHNGTVLGLVVTAARAGLLWESAEAAAPELPLTFDATLRSLAAHVPGATPAAEAAQESYREFAVNWRMPSDRLTNALRAVVADLPAYRIPEAVGEPA